MNLDFEIRTFKGGHFVGMSIMNSVVNNKNFELWSSYMPRRNELKAISSDLFAIQRYDIGHFVREFNPEAEFEILAMQEVSNGSDTPVGMTKLEIPNGDYAVFNYKGTGADFAPMAIAIYSKVIPESAYNVDERPHFQIMGANYYGQENPESEEEIWVPIKS